jgi:hypothetical protein
MLGRLRRTTRLDVGLALCFSGVACLIWFLVAGTSRDMIGDVILYTAHSSAVGDLPEFTRAVKVFFVDAGVAIDLVGLGWMVVSLLLVVYSSRQRISISWAWASAVSQGLVAALGGVVVGYAMTLPYRRLVTIDGRPAEATTMEVVSRLSLPVVLTFSILIWVSVLVWLLVEWVRYKHRLGPTLADGLRTNVYR